MVTFIWTNVGSAHVLNVLTSSTKFIIPTFNNLRQVRILLFETIVACRLLTQASFYLINLFADSLNSCYKQEVRDEQYCKKYITLSSSRLKQRPKFHPKGNLSKQFDIIKRHALVVQDAEENKGLKWTRLPLVGVWG